MIRTRVDLTGALGALGALRGAAGVMLAVVMAASAGSAAADDYYYGEASTEAVKQNTSEFGVNVASVGLTLVYAPVKLTYSALGLMFGSIAYGLSGGDSDVLHAVVTPAIHGDFVVLPKHLRREKEIEFFGRDPDYRQEEVVNSAIFEEVY